MLKTLSYLLPYLGRYKVKYIAGIFFVILANAFRIANPRIIQSAIDYLRLDFSLTILGQYSLAIIGITILEGIFLFLMRKSMIVASREVEYDLRNDFFGRLVDLPASFYQKMPTGDIMSRATNDLSAVRSIVGPGIAYSVNTIMAFCFVIPMMLSINPTLTLFAILPFPIIALLVNRFGKAIYKRFERIQSQFSVLSTRVQENISGSTIIKWFTREKHEVEQFRKDNQEYMKRNISYTMVDAAFRPSLMLTVGLAQALILLIGGRLVMNSAITLGEFTAFLLYMNMLIWPSIALGWVIGLLQQGSASLKRMQSVYEANREIHESSGSLKPETIVGEIEFRGLNFGYTENQHVLEDIHLKIPPRQVTGIIGPTGSGKSTLIRLIPHLQVLPNGTLFIDGSDVNDLSPEHLREFIGYVPQETFLFSDTIHNNIAYGVPDADKKDVIQAATMACIDSEISQFPDGYESMLGEKGINLSGGQKQRVAIARAILRDPRILILDDAFSALDTYTENQILNNLQRFFPDRTVILVSHRVSTLQNADTILVMEDGRISDRGTHTDLISRDGLYAWIHERQLLEDEIEHLDD